MAFHINESDTEPVAKVGSNTDLTRKEYLSASAVAAEKKAADWRSRACITLKEAAHVLSTPPSQLRKLCRQGDLNPITGMGRKWRIATEDIERLLGTRLRNQRPAAQ